MQFGTDGIRGVANEAISVEVAVALGRAAGTALKTNTLLIAADTRASGPMLESALAAGAASAGLDVVLVGVMPTPALAYLCAERNTAGAMISASHNAFGDNGIKFFAPGGLKLDDDTQTTFEQLANADDLSSGLPTGQGVGNVSRETGALSSYVRHVTETFSGAVLSGFTYVLDCANGAATPVAKGVFEAFGAEVHLISAEPNGTNINAGCGSTYPANLQAEVKRIGADAGFAFDGDADRMVAVDGDGEIVDGDHLIAIAAKDMAARGKLKNNTVVVTVMSNLGFKIAMDEAGIDVAVTKVGDRYILECLDEHGHSLGGEQSGHIIFRDVATTGDGVLSALAIAEICSRQNKSLAELSKAAMTRLPQVLKNVKIDSPMPDVAERISAEISEVGDSLGELGRVLVRPSGTEPLVRVMAEASDPVEAEKAVDKLISVIEGL